LLKFPQSVLVSDSSEDEDVDFLPAEVSISRIDDLLAQMRFHEVPKRALFSIPFELATGLVIGIKGYNLVTEQKKGTYKYFVDLGDKMEVVESRTTYVDEVCGRLYVSWGSLSQLFCKGTRSGGQQERRAVRHDPGCDS
jgi:ATP-dependent DNA helicase 2 subunit 1